MSERDVAFQTHLNRSVNYFAAVRSAGDLPWFAAGSPLRDKRVAQLELAADISDEDLRRAVFMRRFA